MERKGTKNDYLTKQFNQTITGSSLIIKRSSSNCVCFKNNTSRKECAKDVEL